jgi:hypothetical protein
MAVWQVVCGLCAVMCVAETRIRPEPFSSFKAPRGGKLLLIVYTEYLADVFLIQMHNLRLGIIH